MSGRPASGARVGIAGGSVWERGPRSLELGGFDTCGEHAAVFMAVFAGAGEDDQDAAALQQRSAVEKSASMKTDTVFVVPA